MLVRKQVNNEKEKAEGETKRRETNRGHTTHAQTNDIMDGMWME